MAGGGLVYRLQHFMGVGIVCSGQSHFEGGRGGVVCLVAGGLGHARHYMPAKISSSCLGPTGHPGVSVCVCRCQCVQVSGVHSDFGLECSF